MEAPTANYQAFDAERHSIGNIIGELNTMSFFGSKRMIVVHNIEAFDKSALEALEKYVGAPSASICLVLTSKGLHRASSLYKKLEKVGVVFGCCLREIVGERENCYRMACQHVPCARQTNSPARC